MMNGNYAGWIKEEALRLGFSYCGIAKAEKLEEDERRLTQWLKHNYHGEMSYMENYFDKRLDPRLLVDGAKSVITLLLNYYPENLQNPKGYSISKYAYGKDYHDVIKDKLKLLYERLQLKIGHFLARGFVDSAPVLERSWALKSGLGWVGKNGNLITKRHGSFFFIATLIVDIDLTPDIPFQTDHCGTCTRCIDACPTQAILPNKVINGSACISYYTIELKRAFVQEDKQWSDWIFGCDICQDVCPWNRFSTPHIEPDLKPLPEILHYSKQDFEQLTEETFKTVFKNSPIKRTKYSGFMRNVVHQKKND